MLTTLNIGGSHSMFNHSVAPNFTQVLVLDENHEVVAQFYGVFAKKLARIFIQKFNEFSLEKIDQNSDDSLYSQLDLVNFTGVSRPITPN